MHTILKGKEEESLGEMITPFHKNISVPLLKVVFSLEKMPLWNVYNFCSSPCNENIFSPQPPTTYHVYSHCFQRLAIRKLSPFNLFTFKIYAKITSFPDSPGLKYQSYLFVKGHFPIEKVLLSPNLSSGMLG